MADKLKLTKDTLNKERKSLSRYSRFLPTLKLRKTQLFNEIHEIRLSMEAKEKEQIMSVQFLKNVFVKVTLLFGLINMDTSRYFS